MTEHTYMTNWAEKAIGQTIMEVPASYEYTKAIGKKFQNLIRSENFLDQDSESIYRFLQSSIEPIPFSKYLKRYLYIRGGFRVPFQNVPVSAYQEELVRSFFETKTPKSFHETSAKFSVLVKGWLNAVSVSRETIFLLGFGLQMSAPDVSAFLTKTIHDQNFDFLDPEETIWWYCLENGLPWQKANELLGAYRNHRNLMNISGDPEELRKYIFTYPPDTERKLWYNLNILRVLHAQMNPYRESYKYFSYLVEETKEEIRKIYSHDSAGFEVGKISVRDADIERVLYNGVPVNQKGNLLKVSLSTLRACFGQYRLTRQRISGILSGRIQVSRYDLITLCFFISAQRDTDVVRDSSYRRFIHEISGILRKCNMGSLNISNPYEAFILLCILTDYPMATFSEVWELSYI